MGVLLVKLGNVQRGEVPASDDESAVLMHVLGWILAVWIGLLVMLLVAVLVWNRPKRRRPWRNYGR